MSSEISKRSASSPPSEDPDSKRLCGDCDNSYTELDSEATIIDPNFLSSTLLDTSLREASFLNMDPSGQAVSRVAEEVKAAIMDPVVLELLSKAVAAQVTSLLRKEMTELHDQLAAKDREIKVLQEQVDSLEQYGRRNNLRERWGKYRQYCKGCCQSYRTGYS